MWAECDLFWIYSDRIYVDLVIEAPLLLFLIRLGRAGERCVSGARCQCTDVLRLEPQPQLLWALCFADEGLSGGGGGCL